MACYCTEDLESEVKDLQQQLEDSEKELGELKDTFFKTVNACLDEAILNQEFYEVFQENKEAARVAQLLLELKNKIQREAGKL